MKEEALHYYHNGYNCSQCILKAAEIVYRIPISQQCYNMCSAVNTGFGVGCMCSVVIAAIMVFGLLHDEMVAKRMRLIFLNEFREIYPCFNCSSIVQNRDKESSCDEIISSVCDIIEDVIVNNPRP